MRHVLLIAIALIGIAAAAEPHVPVKWPVSWCPDGAVAATSPAPALSNSDSLRVIPFTISIFPYSAAVIVSLTPENRPVIECVVDPGYDSGFELTAIDAVAGLVLSAPLAVNTAAPGGRYLVRINTYFGISWVDPPPKLPILPKCPDKPGFWRWNPDAPKPVSRMQPNYPVRALEEEIEGTVEVVLDIFANGMAIPKCFATTTPPGWFENEALEAVAQYRFPEGTKRGDYSVTIKFRLED